MPKFRRTILVNIMSACLIINLSCYNERLIKFFTKYYSEKFSDIFFTVPWCENVKNIPSNLINDYYSYYQWYGNAAVALNKINTDKYDYIVLTTEEGIINPNITEANIDAHFKLNKYRIVIPDAMPLFGFNGWHWYHVRYALYPFIYSANEWQSYLIPFNEAIKNMLSYFGEYDVHLNDSFFAVKAHEKLTREMVEYKEILGGYEHIPYPLAFSMTDILVIKREDIGSIIEQFEKMAAVGVFCEIALPTLVISLFNKAEINCLAKNKTPIKAIPDVALKNVYCYDFEKIIALSQANPFIRFNIESVLNNRG